MSNKRSAKAKAETIRRRTVRGLKRQGNPAGLSLATVESWLNTSVLR